MYCDVVYEFLSSLLDIQFIYIVEWKYGEAFFSSEWKRITRK